MSSRKGGKAPAVAEYAYAEMSMPTATVIKEEEHEYHTKHNHHSTHEKDAVTHNIKQWPNALRDKLVSTFKRAPDEKKAGQLLQMHEWPEGLKGTVYKS